jgi:hypothetical protein
LPDARRAGRTGSGFRGAGPTALVERFSSGRLSARDLICIIGAGLRGADDAVSDEEVGSMRVEGGAAGYARIASELLAATFGAGEGAPPNP